MEDRDFGETAFKALSAAIYDSIPAGEATSG
jgi:hypothetical protein